MVILAVDYGDVRTGLAVCDKSEFLASPVCVINERNAEKVLLIVSEKAKELKAQEIAVGLPKNMDGSEGFRAEACKEFAEKLSAISGIKTVLRDERLTTVSAHKFLNMTDVRGSKRKNTVDAVAAVIILEDYLAYRKNNK
ncbi:MAG: Holliday junction resolvase RuvX [Clostridia bacterium]|nr:Holliday junction resolvase RuvX [Clostridia bacterium]